MLKVLELFGGIGACTSALKRLNIDFEVVDYVDIDKYAVKSYNAINGTVFDPQDITKYNKDIQADLIMHRSPCQDFSVCGKNAGGDFGSGTRSSLMYETLRIVNKIKPKYVIWENVKNLLSKRHIHNFQDYLNIMNSFGYNSYYKILNAKDYGVPQNRERVFTVSIRKDIDNGTFKFPEPEELKIKLKDLLEEDVEEKYYLNNEIKEKILYNYKDNGTNLIGGFGKIGSTNQYHLQNRIYKGDITNVICTTCNPYYLIKNNTEQGYLKAYAGDGLYTNISNKRGTVQHEITPTLTSIQDKGVITNDFKIRKLTPKECWRLMAFSDEEFEKAKKVNTNAQLYKQAGNSIVVNILVKIFRGLNLC